MNLGELINYVLAQLDKDHSGLVLDPDVITLFLQVSNIELFNVKAGLPQRYRPGQPMPSQALEVSQVMTEDLRPFFVRQGGRFTAAMTNQGYVDIPGDFARLSSLRHKYMVEGSTVIKPVPVLFDSEFGIVVSSPLKQPTYRFPVAKFEGDAIQVLPTSVTKLDFTYYRWPKKPFYDFVYVGDNPVYLPPGEQHDGSNLPDGTASRSVELEWSDGVKMEIANRIISKFSQRIRDQFMYSDAEKTKQQGD